MPEGYIVELVYPRGILLPNNYVEIEEEEMMYLDGGLNFTGLYYDVVAFGINCVFNAICDGGTVFVIRSILASSTIINGIKKYAGKWKGTQVANRLFGLILGGLAGFLSFSIGSAAAKLWDRYDTSHNNGICGTPNWL